MSKIELSKSIEATRLNNRTGIPTSDPPVTVPFGGFISDLERDRDFDKFTYLGERYRCGHEVLQAAIASHPAPAAQAAAAQVDTAPAPVAAPPSEVDWEEIKSNHFMMARARVPGGWLVTVAQGEAFGLTFYVDPEHAWTAAVQQ